MIRQSWRFPRGGVPVGLEVAERLVAPLDILIVRKLGLPGQPEVAIGAVADGGQHEIVMNEDLLAKVNVPPFYIENEVVAKLQEVSRMHEIFQGSHPPPNLRGRTVIVVDDGIATGATMSVGIKRLKREKVKKIIVATPVASKEAVALLEKEADAVISLNVPDVFMAVGDFYRDFSQVTNNEVTACLNQARKHSVHR